MKYNFKVFNNYIHSTKKDRPNISLFKKGYLYLSSELLGQNWINKGDKIIVYYDINLKALKIERNEIGRKVSYSNQVIACGLEKIMPIGKYYQTPIINIFKLK